VAVVELELPLLRQVAQVVEEQVSMLLMVLLDQQIQVAAEEELVHQLL
jgi:hypothetical protein